MKELVCELLSSLNNLFFLVCLLAFAFILPMALWNTRWVLRCLVQTPTQTGRLLTLWELVYRSVSLSLFFFSFFFVCLSSNQSARPSWNPRPSPPLPFHHQNLEKFQSITKIRSPSCFSTNSIQFGNHTHTHVIQSQRECFTEAIQHGGWEITR